MRSDLVFPVRYCRFALPSPRSNPSASIPAVSTSSVRYEDEAHLDTIVGSGIFVHDARNLWCRSGARNFTIQMFGRVQKMMVSLHGHALDPHSDPNFRFSALN